MEHVNHPTHYQSKEGKECIDVMEEHFGKLAVIFFSILNTFKYNWRAGLKPGNSEEQDINKAKWYHARANFVYNRLNKLQKFILTTFFKRVVKEIKSPFRVK